MNILIYFQLPIIPHIGGVQRVSDILAKGFISKGHKVFFLCTSSNENDELIAEYADNFTAPQFSVIFDRSEQSKSKTKLILEDNKIDIIINQFDFSPLSHSLELYEYAGHNISKITCYHSMPFHFKGKARRLVLGSVPVNFTGHIRKYLTMIFPQIYTYLKVKQHRLKFSEIISVSDKFCLLSDCFISDFLTIMNLEDIDSKKIIAINNPNTFNCDNIVDSPVQKDNVILFVGRLEASQKSPIDFLKVWSRLHTVNPAWNAVVVGDGSELCNMKKYAQQEKLTNIYFEGNQSIVANYFKKAKFICLTSVYEGWGMVLTEGMAYGCVPLAYGTYGAVYDIIDNGVSGYVTKPFDTVDMSEKIQFLIDNPSVMKSYSEASERRVRLFSIENILGKWESQFNQLKGDE